MGSFPHLRSEKRHQGRVAHPEKLKNFNGVTTEFMNSLF